MERFTSKQSCSADEEEVDGAQKCPSSSGGGGADCRAPVQPGRGKCAPGCLTPSAPLPPAFSQLQPL